MVANLPRYEIGRCVSCGDCNREPAYVDESGEWVKFEEAAEASSNHVQQLQAKIRARVEQFAQLGSWRQDSDAINVFLADLRELSAVQ